VCIASLCYLISAPVFAQVRIEGVDKNGSHISEQFSEGTAISISTFRDTIQVIHSLDFNGEVPVIVILDEPPLSMVRANTSGTLAKAQAVISALGRISSQHESVITEIRRLENAPRQGFHKLKKSSTITHKYVTALNGMALRTTRRMVAKIRKIPGVRSVHEDRIVQASSHSVNSGFSGLITPSLTSLTGEGIVISIIDTGIDYNHPALGEGFGPEHRVIGGYDFINDDADPMDDHGHGTHVAGIAAGLDTVITGIATEASLLAIKVLDESGFGMDSSVIAGVERSLDPDQDPLTDDAADVINMSLGGPGGPDDPMATAVNNAVLAGVVCVVAAGNEGSGERYQSIGSPGVAEYALTIGATNDLRQIAPFSSRGPTPASYAIKPDILAPGVDINSAAAGGGYVQFSGTSMASPFVAGVVALLIEAHPNWTPSRIKSALMLSADDAGYDVWTQGGGFVNLAAASALETVIEPASLSPGIVSSLEDIWTWSDTLLVSNLSLNPKTYLVQHDVLPAGMSAVLSNSQITLQPGGSTDVILELEIDNEALPFSDANPPAYESQVIFTSVSDTLFVPFALIKSHALNFTFSEEPWVVELHDDEGGLWTYAYPGEALNALLPSGEYDLTVKFGDEEISTLIKENIAIDGDSDIFIDKADAEHTISAVGTAYDGSLLPLNFVQRLISNDRGYGTFTTTFVGGDVDRIDSNMSSLVADYVFDIRTSHFALPGSVLQTFHDGPRRHFDEIEASVLITNDQSDVSAIDYEYAVDPGTTELFVFDYVCDVGSCSSRYATEGPSAGRVTEPFSRRVYLTAADTDEFFFRQEVYRTDGVDSIDDAETYLYNMAHIQTSETQMTFFRFLDFTNPVFEISRAAEMRMPVGFPGIHWAGRTYNRSDPFVRFGGMQDDNGNHGFGFFQDHAGAIRPSEFTYDLLQDGLSISQGTIEDTALGEYFHEIPASPGEYQLDLDFQQFYVAGIPSSVHVELLFDMANPTDSNPPFITRLSLLSDGQIVESLGRSARNEMYLEVMDDFSLSDVTVNIRETALSEWTPLSVELQSDQFVTVMPDTLGAGYYDVLISVTDTEGNRLNHRVSPAFHVAGIASPILSSPATLDYDISVTPELGWYPVPGATTYRLEIALDSSFTFPILTDSLITATGASIGPLEMETQHFWRVRASNTIETGAWSIIRSFYTLSGRPESPELSYPEIAAIDVVSSPILSWEAIPDAIPNEFVYHLQVAENSDFSLMFLEDSTLSTTSTDPILFSYSTTYYWRVRAVNDVGPGDWSETRKFTIAVGTASEGTASDLPLEYALHQSYPNPTNHRAILSFDLPETSNVSLIIIDAIGRQVAEVISGHFPAGRYRHEWNVGRVPSGLYMYTLRASGYTTTRKLLVIK